MSITDFPMKDGLVQVMSGNLESVLDAKYEIMVFLCAPYIDLCKSARKSVVRSAKFLSLLDDPIYIGESDTQDNKDLMEQFNVTYLPSLVDVFSFGREPEIMKISFVDTMITTAALLKNYKDFIEITSMEQWEKLNGILSVFMLGLFENDNNDEYDSYKKLAGGKSNAVFLISTLPELLHQFHTVSHGLYAIHVADKGITIEFTGDMKVYNQMSDFVDMNEFPLVIDYDDKLLSRSIFDNKRIKNQLVFFYNEKDEEYEEMVDEYNRAAQSLLGETYCIKASLETSERLLHFFGIYDNPTKSLFAHSSKGRGRYSTKYLFEEEVTKENLLSFVRKAMRQDTSLHRLVMSAPLPDESDIRGASEIIVQRNWEEKVMNPKDDVIVLYMSARCDECINIELDFIELSEEYEETEHLKFFRTYSDRNEYLHKSTVIETHPAIRFYPRAKDGKVKEKWIKYKGKLTAKGIEKFIRKHATVELPEAEDDEDEL